jgi:D-alanyl-D-alanine carboxypeptidase/D-alanyl-D-alanine-endopeptidase (penicillin-binding protein 4)
VLVLAGALATVLWGRGDLNALICDGDCGPAYVVAPEALTSATSPDAADVDAAPAGALDPAAVAAAVDDALDAADLGPHVGFVALDGRSGDVLHAQAAKDTFVPASATKLLTAFAALSALDPQHRFTTRVVRDGDRVVLVGGGDPFLATKRPKERDRVVRADLTTLARQTADRLADAGVESVKVGYDASLFAGPDASKGWEPSYVRDNIVTPVSALWADQGVTAGVRADDPAASAAGAFATALQDAGIDVDGEPRAAEAPKQAAQLAAASSATVAQLVDRLLRTSDNEASEVMLRHVAAAEGQPASFAGGAKAVTKVLRAAGVPTKGLRLFDGSGLSRRNQVTPTTLAETLRAAAGSPGTASLAAGLPVSGFSGTLLDRFAQAGAARGLVRAKTGTLTGVHALAGYALDDGGRPVVFAAMTDGTEDIGALATQAALDRVAAALAGCSCGR